MTTLSFSCTHFPYHHPGVFDFLADLARQHRPDAVVCLGDEADLYNLSRYAKSPEMPSWRQELTCLRSAVKRLGAIFPDLRLCDSNHPRRLYARAAEGGLLEETIRPWGEIIGAPAGWEWRPRWKVGGATYFHGEEAGGAHAGRDMVNAFQSNVVFGHLHGEAGVQFFRNFVGQRWSLQSGCLIRPGHPAFSYGKLAKKQSILGASLVAGGVPMFIPMK